MTGLLLAAAVLAVDILSILDVAERGRDAEQKAVWIILIVLLPVAGPLLYFLLGRRRPLAGLTR